MLCKESSVDGGWAARNRRAANLVSHTVQRRIAVPKQEKRKDAKNAWGLPSSGVGYRVTYQIVP